MVCAASDDVPDTSLAVSRVDRKRFGGFDTSRDAIELSRGRLSPTEAMASVVCAASDDVPNTSLAEYRVNGTCSGLAPG